MAENWLLPDGGSSFPVTSWTIIEQLQESDPTDVRTALNRLIARYWKPVFYYLRARGRSFHEAQDLTQEFFTRLVERNWLRLAERGRGRFRSFLLTILDRFLVDQAQGRVRRQHSFEEGLLRVGQLITDEEHAFEPKDTETPETVYMKRWATDLLAAVMGNLKRLCEEEGRLEWYELFEATRLEHQPEAQHALAACFGLTRDALRHRVDVLEKRLARLLRAEVREQVGSEAEVDLELVELRDWLGR